MTISYRERMRALADAETLEAAFGSPDLTAIARTRIIAVLEGVVTDEILANGEWLIRKVDRSLRAEGTIVPALRDTVRVLEVLTYCAGNQFLDAVEATVEQAAHYNRLRATPGEVQDELKRILREERIAIDFTDGQFLRFTSQELHEEVVAPAITLLAGKDGWESVEVAYRNALEEPDPSDAITDVGTALQEAFNVLGFAGNQLGDQIRDAQRNDWILGHDAKLLKAIADFVSADRSEMGDSHRASRPTDGDAWLAIHVAGALILRLAEGQRTR